MHLERRLGLALALMPMLLGSAAMPLALAHGGFVFTAGLVGCRVRGNAGELVDLGGLSRDG